MDASNTVKDRELERQGKRMIGPGVRFIAIGAVLAIVGIVLILIGHGWSIGFGIAALLLGSVPATIGFGLLSGGAVARWAARHKLFA
jgi:predicted acyltransferase